jgi:hypothetical protein
MQLVLRHGLVGLDRNLRPLDRIDALYQEPPSERTHCHQHWQEQKVGVVLIEDPSEQFEH